MRGVQLSNTVGLLKKGKAIFDNVEPGCSESGHSAKNGYSETTFVIMFSDLLCTKSKH